jgi:hypothetical protein
MDDDRPVDDTPVIPEDVEPDTVEISFVPVKDAVPGLAMRRGEYVTDQGVKLVLLAAADEQHARELDDEFLRGLGFWARMTGADGTPVAEEDGPFDVGKFARELIDDQDALNFTLQVGTDEPSDSRFMWLIDKPIAANYIHWYAGGDSVHVSANYGSVRFRRPYHDPLVVPPARTRAARGGCSIRAFAAADYNIQGAGQLLKITHA